MSKGKGRPAVARQRVERYLAENSDATYSRIARACHLFDYRDARRIVRQIERRGIFTPVREAAA